MIKICLSGKLGSGKNLFLELAEKNFPELEIFEEKFAYPIYDIQEMIQDKLNIENHKDGKLLQFIGNHFREYDKDIWVKQFIKRDKYCNDDNVIITDCRFPNELEACNSLGYTTVRIKRQQEFRGNNLGNRDFNHISETSLDKYPDVNFDFTINNNGSLEMFEEAVKQVVRYAQKVKK